MQNLEPSVPLAPSALFQLWITQWRLGILRPCEATLVLSTVLRDLCNRRVDGPLWEFLREYLAPPVEGPGIFLHEDRVEAEQLLHSALSLQPQQAKALLEHLGQCYAFNGDGLQFWRAVREAIELHAVAPCEPVHPD